MSSGPIRVRLAIPIAVAAIGAAACSAASSPSPPAATPGSGAATTPTAQTANVDRVSRCHSVVPAAYRIDPAHSGSVSATTYSAAADVQAALEFDQLTSGQRTVYLHRSAGRVDGVASCVVLNFPSAHNAQRFFDSYKALRREAGRLARPTKVSGNVPGGTVGYREIDQSFVGYKISSTTVVEAAARTGSTLTIASTADRAASPALSGRLLVAVEGSA